MSLLDGLTYDSTAAQVVEAIVEEVVARGYTRGEAIGVVADGYQESGFRMVWDPSRRWFGYYQQDGSYPNRANPAGNVRGFLDRLDVKRRSPGHGDIWGNIFWLQQRPSEDSAADALNDPQARPAYLTEIKSRTAWATTMVDKYWPVNPEGTPMAVSGDPVWLEDVWREALGDRLIVEPGWRDRGVGGTMGLIWGTMIHHTGNDNERVEIIRDGVQQPSGWLPGPLAQALITRDGKLHLIAVGPCNHAGSGNWGTLTSGNQQAIGIECAYDGDPARWPDAMVITMRDAAAAVSKHIGKRAQDSVCGHKEYAKPQGRKVDPANMDMDWFRGEVQKDLDGFVFPGENLTTTPPPTPPTPEPTPEQVMFDQTSAYWEMLGWRTPVEALAALLDKALGTSNAGKPGMSHTRPKKP